MIPLSTYKDSVGNTYTSLPKAKPTPSAKPSKGGKNKYGRNKVKCERYRMNRGRPNGPGQKGNKSGAKKG